MNRHLKFFIDGSWIDPAIPETLDVVDPSTEEAYTRISSGSAADVDRAVAAAKSAFVTFSQTTKAERLDLLRRVLKADDERYEDIAQAVSREMGAPILWARDAQAAAGQAHLQSTIKALEQFEFSNPRGTTMIRTSPSGAIQSRRISVGNVSTVSLPAVMAAARTSRRGVRPLSRACRNCGKTEASEAAA